MDNHVYHNIVCKYFFHAHGEIHVTLLPVCVTDEVTTPVFDIYAAYLT